MKPKHFPLSVLIWTMGFPTFAQTDCLQLQTNPGLILRIRESSNQWINLGRHDHRRTQSLELSPDQLVLDEFSRSGFFQNVKYSIASFNESDCAMNGIASIGWDCLRGNAWHFDLDAMRLCKVNRDGIRLFEKNGYTKVPAKITSENISVELEVRRQRHSVKLDFWFDGMLMLKSDPDLPFFKEGHSIMRTIGGNIREYPNMAVKFDETFYSGSVLLGDDNKVGIGFIKGFNWLVDMRTRSIYIKKNNHSIDSGSTVKNKVVVKSGALTITASGSSRFSPGDVIAKIDSEPVTANNACQWAARLNETSSWQNFAIELVNRQP